MYCLTVLEVRSLNRVSGNLSQGVGRVVFLPEGLGQNSILPGSSFRGCLHPLACGSSSASLDLLLLSSHPRQLNLLLPPLLSGYISFPDDSVVKELTCNAGDTGDAGLIPGSGRSPRGGHGNPFQYSCLENPMDRGAWPATVHRLSKI